MVELAAVVALVAAEQSSEEHHLADVAGGRRHGLAEVRVFGGEDQRLPLVRGVAAVQREPGHPIDEALERAKDGPPVAAAVDQDVEAVGPTSVVVDHAGRDDRTLNSVTKGFDQKIAENLPKFAQFCAQSNFTKEMLYIGCF